MEEEQGRISRRFFSVAPSPLNAVKFELGVILLVSVFLLIAINGLVADSLWQIMILAAYGLAGAVWITVRARRVLQLQRSGHDHHGA